MARLIALLTPFVWFGTALSSPSARACDIEVTLAGGTVYVKNALGAPARNDDVTVSTQGDAFRVVDPNALVCATGVPWSTLPHGVDIPRAAVTAMLDIRLRDGEDRLTFVGALDLGAASLVGTAREIVVRGDIVSSGNGSVVLASGRSVLLDTGSSIATVDGALTLQGNALGAGSGPPADSVRLTGASLTTSGAGTIAVSGKGWPVGSGSGSRGVHIQNGSTIETTGTGLIFLSGIGGSGENENKGIDIADAGTLVRSKTGISIAGIADKACTGSSNHAVSIVYNGPVIAATGSAGVYIDAVGGGGASNNIALEIGDAASRITTEAGDIEVTARRQDATSPTVVIRDGGAIESATGKVTFVTQSFSMTSSVAVKTGGGIVVRPYDFIKMSMGLGSAAGDLAIDAGVLSRLAPGNAGLTVGGVGMFGSLHAADVTVAWPLTLFAHDVDLDGVSAGALVANAETGRVTASAEPIVGSVAAGGVVRFAGVFAPGPVGVDAPAVCNIQGRLVLDAATTTRVDLVGTTPGTGHDQLVVQGAVDVTDSALVLVRGAAVHALGDRFVLIDNDGSDAIVGTFAGVAEGSLVTADGATYAVSYRSGDGNDLVLERSDVPIVVEEEPVAEPVADDVEPEAEVAPEPVADDVELIVDAAEPGPEAAPEAVAESTTGSDVAAEVADTVVVSGKDDDGCAATSGLGSWLAVLAALGLLQRSGFKAPAKFTELQVAPNFGAANESD